MRPVRLLTASLTAGALLVGAPAVSARAATTPAPSLAAAATAAQDAAAASTPSGVRAPGAELAIDGTGRVLWGKQANVRRPMGSITKVMTALVVLRAGHLSRKIKITQAVINYIKGRDASNAGLKAGDTLTAAQLLNAMLIPSGCDAAYALAQAYGPGTKAFIAKMNAAARSLGMINTHFSNFDGLPWPTETSTYSTPKDLLTLGRAAMSRTIFRAIADRKSYHLPAGAGRHAYTWLTTNELLGGYSGAIGVKTGSTDAAGYCLLFAATRRGKTLIGVVLHSSTTSDTQRFTDAERVLNWGFGQPNAAFRIAPLAPGANTD